MLLWSTRLIAGFGAVSLAAHEILRQIWVFSNQVGRVSPCMQACPLQGTTAGQQRGKTRRSGWPLTGRKGSLLEQLHAGQTSSAHAALLTAPRTPSSPRAACQAYTCLDIATQVRHAA